MLWTYYGLVLVSLCYTPVMLLLLIQELSATTPLCNSSRAIGWSLQLCGCWPTIWSRIFDPPCSSDHVVLTFQPAILYALLILVTLSITIVLAILQHISLLYICFIFLVVVALSSTDCICLQCMHALVRPLPYYLCSSSLPFVSAEVFTAFWFHLIIICWSTLDGCSLY